MVIPKPKAFKSKGNPAFECGTPANSLVSIRGRFFRRIGIRASLATFFEPFHLVKH